MRLLYKIACYSSSIACSGSVMAVTNRVDIMSYVGYPQLNAFSDAVLDNTVGTLTGYDLGVSIFKTLRERPLAPIVGIGFNYTLSQSSVSFGGTNYKNNYSSFAGMSHVGFRILYKRVKFFLVGNAGYGLSDSLSTTGSQANVTTSSTTYSVKNHFILGGSAIFLVTVSPRLKLGFAGVANEHLAAMTSSTNYLAKTTYNEYTGNFVIDFIL